MTKKTRGKKTLSCADAIAKIFKEHLDKDGLK
jgi:hypothetical protein